MSGRWASWGAVVVAAGVALIAGVALANDTILHEYFVVPASSSSSGPMSHEPLGDEASALSEALAEGGEGAAGAQQPPSLSVDNRGDELEYEANGQPISPSGEALPEHNGPFSPESAASLDRQTTLDTPLSYYSVFNPSVAPWKRVTARNHVEEDYRLTVRSPRRRLEVKELPLRSGYERFWGSMLVRLEAGRPVPLPSVAAQVNVLRYQTEPPVELTFLHEYVADNYYVQANYTGTVRINFLMEAHASYFGGEIDERVKVADLPASMRPKLPARLRGATERVIAAIGVDREGSFKAQLDALVAWFRGFEARDFPPELATEDIYLDVALNKLGVCRHRAMAFTITAQALGIATRYVHNEAHAWVEVYIPRRGWLRVDLGGAAVDFEMRNASDKTLHTPPERDSLPQPPEFASSYSHRIGTGQQEADVNADGAGESIEGVPDATTAPRLGAQDDPQGSSPRDEGAGEAPLEDSPLADQASDSVAAGAGAAAAEPEFPSDAPPASVSAAAPPRRQTAVKIIKGPGREEYVFRGEGFRVRGRLQTDQGLGLGGRKVDAYLVPGGSAGASELQLVGSALTQEDGEVEVEVKIPPTANLGLWKLYLFFPGDANFERSHSN